MIIDEMNIAGLEYENMFTFFVCLFRNVHFIHVNVNVMFHTIE